MRLWFVRLLLRAQTPAGFIHTGTIFTPRYHSSRRSIKSCRCEPIPLYDVRSTRGSDH